jgi:ubiquinone/menaquinone biosynthesis C-methylase UbiE
MGLPASLLVGLNVGHFKYKAPKDDPVAYSRWEYEEGRRVWNRFFASRVPVAGKDMLDIGCGPGGKSCFFATLHPRMIMAVDISADSTQLAERARELLIPPEDRLALEFACVDAADLPFPDAYFDVVACSDSFEHFARPRDVLSEAARVLRTGGLMAIDFAQWGSYNGHHLGDFFSTPWLHIFWSGKAVESAVVDLASRAKNRSLDPLVHSGLDDLVRRRLDHFVNGLNRLSLSSFEKFLNDERRFKIKWSYKTVAHPVLWPLKFVPGARELAVARNVYVLERI